jgi:hypothetical protein
MPADVEKVFSAEAINQAMKIPNYHNFRVWLENALITALQKIKAGGNLTFTS